MAVCNTKSKRFRTGRAIAVSLIENGHTPILLDNFINSSPLVAQRIGRAQMKAFAPERVGLMIAGLEVPHVHLHVVPMNQAHDLDFARQNANADAADLDSAAEQLREALALLGE